jgi:hypothetical protein
MQAINRTSSTRKPAWKKSQKLNAAAMMLAVGLCMASTSAQAAPIIIEDNYIGGSPTSPAWVGQDIVGNAAHYDVSKLEISFASDNTMIVDVYSRYFDNIGDGNTQLGDLFISSNGYQGDGEVWEYALKLDSYRPTTGSGAISLYNVLAGNIQNSFAPGYIYRAGQEVQYTGTGQTALATGGWSLNNIGGTTDTDDYLRFTIAYDFGDVDTYGLHWGMTCGNDVIEGAATVPEPPTMLLFGIGLIGLGGALRQRMQPNNDIRIK